MQKLLNTFIAILWLAVCFSSAAAASAQEQGINNEMIESRLTDLRLNNVASSDEKVKAYEAAQLWLRQAASHDRDTANYIEAITTAPQREAKIQSRMESFVSVEITPDSFSNLSLQELSEQIRLTRTQLFEAENVRDRIEQRLANREVNASRSHSRLNDISSRLTELSNLNVTIDPQGSPSLEEGLLWASIAEQISLNAEQRAQQARLDSQPVRYSALRAERAELEIEINQLNRKLRNLESSSRNQLSNIPKSQELEIQADSPAFAIAQQLTTSNTLLREQQLILEKYLVEITAKQDKIEQLTLVFEDRFTTARRIVDFASDSDILGKVLLAHWNKLQADKYSGTLASIRILAGNYIISRISHEEELANLVNSSIYIDRQIQRSGLENSLVPDYEREKLVILARIQHEQLRRLIALESTYIDNMRQLEADHIKLMSLTHDYETYLSTLILWVPSRPPLWKTDPSDILSEIKYLKTDMKGLRPTVHHTQLTLLLISGLLFFARSRLKEWQFKQHREPLWLQDNPLRFNLLALLATVLRALPIPLIVLSIGMFFSNQTLPFTVVLTTTINGLSAVLFALMLVHILCERTGLAIKHFGWKPYTCKLLNQRMGWLIFWWLPVATIGSFLFMLDYGTVVLGRFTLLFSLVLLATSIVREIRRDLNSKSKRQLSNNQNHVRILLTTLMILLIVGIIWGLRYSVIIVATRLMFTLLVSLALVFFYNIILTWLRGLERRARLAVENELEENDSEFDEKEETILAEISDDTTRLLNAVTMTASLFILYYIWTPLFPALDALARVSLWQSSTMVDGESVTTQITLETLVIIITLASVTIYAARKLPALVELILHSRTRVSSGSRFAVTTLLSYLIVGSGFLAALAALGLKWSQLQWLIAALSIGIGFGLQEIIANFISGVIILFERPIRVGDFISVGPVDGIVTKIRIRATTIQKRDSKELIVPNKEFITGQLLNWTLSNQHVMVTVPVGIAYGSNVEAALKIVQEVAKDYPKVVDHPEPLVILSNFGDNSLNLELRCFINHVEGFLSIASDLHRLIYNRFYDNGIVIAFPQRDIHFDHDQPLKILIDRPPKPEI